MARRPKNRGDIGCPRHGKEFMVSEGTAYYCAAPTPNERPKKCFWHPTYPNKKIDVTKMRWRKKYASDKVQGNVMKALFGDGLPKLKGPKFKKRGGNQNKSRPYDEKNVIYQMNINMP